MLTVGARDFGRANVREPQPSGGPVGGIVAGARALAAAGCRRALVLAVDAPTVLGDDLAPLIEAPAPGAAYAHLHLPLVIDIDALPADAGPGWSMARLITAAGLPLLDADPSAATRLRGANTPEERAALLEAFLARGPAAI
ncbi:molybdenum cofactor guanylyltransferase [Phenylobacterium sp. J367]|uniref:molybdenum cofactor guanylyltransferase n=1 Tax=Phenylobacterium sp. J367 TaxID=2898435 RepID=UPI0027E29ECE|nr:molybdenum cofactor guanylyltransferase [Phenylobacterium sp. J367]